MATTTTETTAATVTAGTAVPAGGEHHGGFPPFDPTTFSPQLFWLGLTFLLLYLLLSRLALPRIGSVIEARKSKIEGDLQEAERLKGETAKALAAYEQALAEARGKATGIAQETRDKLKGDTEAERRRVEKELADKLAEAEGRILKAKSAALANVGTIAAETAEAIVGQLIGVRITGDEAKAAVAAHAKGS